MFDTVADAVRATGADASMIFVPPPFAADAIVEAADAGVGSSPASPRGSRPTTCCAPAPFLDRQDASGRKPCG